MKRKFATDAEWAKHQDNHRQYQLMQSARKNERRALLIKTLTTPRQSKFRVVREKCRSIIRKRENTSNENKNQRWNRFRGVR